MPTPNPFAYQLTQPIPMGNFGAVGGGVPVTGGAPIDTSQFGAQNAPTFMDRLRGIFNDPNFYRILGEGAQAVAPGSTGAMLGQVGSKAIGAIQQQEAVETAEQRRQQQNMDLIKVLGGITPKGQPGVTKWEIKPDGSINIGLDMMQDSGSVNSAGGTGGGGGVSPSGPVNLAPVGTGLSTFPTSNAGGSATGGGTELAELLPFLSGRGRR